MADIVGTIGDDFLSGTADGGDTIAGLAGNDSLSDSDGGNDTLDGPRLKPIPFSRVRSSI